MLILHFIVSYSSCFISCNIVSSSLVLDQCAKITRVASVGTWNELAISWCTKTIKAGRKELPRIPEASRTVSANQAMPQRIKRVCSHDSQESR